MFIPSEITLKPGTSNLYPRFMLVLTLFSIILLFQTSIVLLLKVLILFLLLWQFKTAYRFKSACPFIEIRGSLRLWILLTKDSVTRYEKAEILFHNVLFLLLKLSDSELKTKRWIIIFTDQLTKTQIRLLHLRITLNSLID